MFAPTGKAKSERVHILNVQTLYYMTTERQIQPAIRLLLCIRSERKNGVNMLRAFVPLTWT